MVRWSTSNQKKDAGHPRLPGLSDLRQVGLSLRARVEAGRGHGGGLGGAPEPKSHEETLGAFQTGWGPPVISLLVYKPTKKNMKTSSLYLP